MAGDSGPDGKRRRHDSVYGDRGEREHLAVSKNCKVWLEIAWGLIFYSARRNVRCTPRMRVSLFLVLEARVLQVHLIFHCNGRCTGSSASCIDPKVRRAPIRRVSFQLALSSTVQKFSPTSPTKIHATQLLNP
jgi:hypothetical protein